MIHVVVQGECLASIAKQYGFPDWQIIYNDSQNAALRQKRPNPDVLFPGDEVFIPERKLKDESGGSGQSLTFQLSSGGTHSFLNLALEGIDGKPLAQARYALKVGEEVFEGTTKNDGSLSQEVPPDIQSGELTVYQGANDSEPVRFTLAIGHLDPVEEISGVKARLANLGLYDGPIDNSLDEEVESAVKELQELHQLSRRDGKIDSDVRSLLNKLYGL